MILYAIFGLYAQEKFNYGPQEVGVVIMLIGFIITLIWLKGDLPTSVIRKEVDQTTPI